MSLGRIVRGCITEIGRGGAYVPARVALQGRIRRSSPAHHACIFGMETPPPVSPYKGAFVVKFPAHHACIFLVWKHRYADVRAGTQAPPLRFRLGGLRVGGFVCWLVKTVHMNQHHRCCTFVSPGLIEHSEIYPG